MLNFIDITKELPYQSKDGIPYVQFGRQYATDDYPLDFQYLSDESIISFEAIKQDYLGNNIGTINLSTSLIELEYGNHVCTGLIAYATPLDTGLYYFIVNSKYKSEDFNVITITESSFDADSVISICGLNFIDNTKELPAWDKVGASYPLFGVEYASTKYPLNFQYKSSEVISSFKAVKVTPDCEIMAEVDLNTSLITSLNGIHTCTGTDNYTSDLDNSMYYFIVNDKYISNLFINSELFKARYLKLIGDGFLKLIGGGYLKIIS